MALITVICSGMMGTAITYPAAENGHTIRLVGSPLDNEIIEHGKKQESILICQNTEKTIQQAVLTLPW